MSRAKLGLTLAAACLAACAAVAAVAARTLDNTISVVFHANQTVTATLQDGRTLGTTSGTPTVIAPGHYNVILDDSLGVSGPSFDLQGPGVKLYTDMFYGENPSESYGVDFAPNTTYTWRDDAQPSVVFTFVTSGAAATGTSTATSGAPSTTKTAGGTSASSDVVGSGILAFRGSLDVIVYKSKKVSLTRNGNAVKTLPAGRYTFSVDDESRAAGFAVRRVGGARVVVTTARYVGSHALTVALTAGRWTYAHGAFVVTP